MESIARDAAAVCCVSLALIGCSDSSDPEPGATGTGGGGAGGGGGGCGGGALLLEDGSCLPAGLPPDMQCPPGELALDGGGCQSAGVAAGACAVGFEHDGDRGCEPILPAAPCPPGQIAVPGDQACRAIAACGSALWGDIPVDASSEHVDLQYSGSSDGSAAAPWKSIQQGVDAAAAGAIVAVAAGDYLEDVVIGSASLRATLVEDSSRAGISSFGAHVSLAGSWLSCQSFDLNGEPAADDGHEFTFDDLGGNICGCGEQLVPCKVLSANLSPPGQLDPDLEL